MWKFEPAGNRSPFLSVLPIGFENGTGDVQLEVSPENSQRIQPNTVTLMIAQPAAKGSVSVHLLDNVTGAELARFTPIEMNITM